MPRTNKTKTDFPHDEHGRAILGTAKEMAAWVKIGFEEQDERKSPDDPFYQPFIDLRKCVLYISYPLGSKTPSSRIFNMCDMAGIVPGIEKIEDNPNYLYEVKYDIHFDDSVLYGNFFHYVRFDGVVKMDNTTVPGSFSCFKCLFRGFTYLQKIHLQGGFDFEQCEFSKGLVMNYAEVGGINAMFNNSIIKERLSMIGAQFTKQEHSNPIEFNNCTVENLNISRISTEGLKIRVDSTSVHGMRMDDLKHEGVLVFNSCDLDGIITSVVVGKDKPNNVIKELLFNSCDIKAQYHIENGDIEKLEFSFGKIDDSGRLRLFQCNVGELLFGSSTVAGRLDIVQSKILSIDLDETCVQGFINFQANEVKKYENRQTLSLLKNEALKVNDEVSALPLYAQEMESLLSDNRISCWDKVSLWLNKLFSNYGESWTRAFWVTLGFSVALTLLMLGAGSSKYMFDPSCHFIGFGPFVTILLDSINVFSIPLFSDTIEKYELNVFGQVLYFIIKVVVAYGVYQFVVAFRKHGRR